MKILADGRVKLHAGDCLRVLATMPAASVDCVVTSPPYWGLRDYGVAGQIGLESSLDAYVDALAAVAGQLWRVLKPTGTLWLNLGDCYATGAGRAAQPGGGPQGARACYPKGGQVPDRKNPKAGVPAFQPNRMPQRGLKPKDLCLVPARVALRLQADGWWLRSEIVWAKPNPMPESVRDRPTSAHEKVWLLTKGERYFYNADAIREEFADKRQGNPGAYLRTSSKNKGTLRARQDGGLLANRGAWTRGADLGGRNARNVWTLAPQPWKGAHFATMPPALAERCIKAGCPLDGHVLDPFAGAGTTGLVALRLGRCATLIDLNPAYLDLQAARLAA